MPAGWDQLRSRVLHDKDALRPAMLARSVGAMIGAWQTEQPAGEQPGRTAHDGGGEHGLDHGNIHGHMRTLADGRFSDTSRTWKRPKPVWLRAFPLSI
jgi:hypothetical protein